MSDQESTQHARMSGEKVWMTIRNQLAEGRGFLGAMFTSFKAFLRKQLLFLVLFGVLGAAAGAGIWYALPKVYEAEMTVSYNHYEKKIYADMLEKLDRLVENKSFSTLSKLLALPIESVEKIRGVKGLNIRREDLADDLSTQKVPFYVVVGVTDLDILDGLEPALVDYMNGTDFIQDRLAYMKEKSEADLLFLENRLQMVDSLSKLLILQDDNLLNEKQVTRLELLQEAMTLHNKIQEVKGSLKFNLNIEVLDGFVANEMPSGKGMLFWMVYGFLAGVLLWLVILLFR